MRPFILRGHERPINMVKFNYDGDLFFSASADNKVNMWESYTGERIGSFGTKAAVKSIDIDDDTKHLITGCMDGTVQVDLQLTQIFKAENGQPLKWFKFPNKIRYVEYSVGDKLVLFLEESFVYEEGSQITVFEMATLLDAPQEADKGYDMTKLTPKIKFQAKGKNGKNKHLTKVSWYLNNSAFIASGADGTLIKYDLNGNIVAEIQAHESSVEIRSFALARDCSILATAAVNGCRVFDPETFQLLKTFKQELPMNTVSISPLMCSETNPKYHLIIGGGISARESAMTAGNAGFDIILCNVMYENELGSIPGHFSPINCL